MIRPELKLEIVDVVKKVTNRLIFFQYPEKSLPKLDEMTLFIARKSNNIISLIHGDDYGEYEIYLQKKILIKYNKALKTKYGECFIEFFKEEANRTVILDSEVGADISSILPKFKNKYSIKWLKENIVRLDRIDLIKQIHLEGTIALTTYEADMAIKYSSQSSLIYLINNCIVEPTENSLMYRAVISENKEIQQLLVDYGANIHVGGVSAEDTRLSHIKEYISKKDFNTALKEKLEEKPLNKKMKI